MLIQIQEKHETLRSYYQKLRSTNALSNTGTSSAIAAAAAAAAMATAGIEREGLRIPTKVNRKQSMSSRVLSTSASNKMSTSYKSSRSDRNRNNNQKDGSTASSHKRQDSNG